MTLGTALPPTHDAALELNGAKHVQTKTNNKLDDKGDDGDTLNNETVATMKQVRRSPVPTYGPPPVHTRTAAKPSRGTCPSTTSSTPPQLTSDSPLIPAPCVSR